MSPHVQEEEHKLILRNIRPDDFEAINRISEKIYSRVDGGWERDQFNSLIKHFAEGQICIEDNGEVIAAAFSLIVDYKKYTDNHTYSVITDQGYIRNHDPEGDVLYGVDIFVDPDRRGLRLGRRLYEARKEMCRNLNLRAIIAGGRIPGYEKYKDELSPHQYIEKVSRKEIYDPILTFQVANEFEVKRLMTKYMPEDDESGGYATLLEWSNIYYQPIESKIFQQQKTHARVGVVQWQMRTTKSVDALMRDVEFFVDALSDYQCDFAVFPEFFSAPLLGTTDQSDLVRSIRELAGYTQIIIDRVSSLAVSYNINVIAGSLPVVDGDDLFNISYLCRRDGTIAEQTKIHVTPNERRTWVMTGGNKLQIIETDVCKIGILICYDVEFPELARLLAEQDMKILFVPFWTDTKNGYLRVRSCAQARAIENECYVCISGSVGNLPNVENAEIQYAQSVIFTPSDFSFPHDGIVAETTPNTEMTLICDLDLTKLEKLKYEGAVTNSLDRRTDLYTLSWNEKLL